jgi:membrane protein YdbS with pleckstrin-like domain
MPEPEPEPVPPPRLPTEFTAASRLFDPDADPEVDIRWCGYSPWAVLPGLLPAAGLTVGVAYAGWRLSAVRGPWAELAVLLVGCAVAAAWLFLGVRWGYRLAAFAYRLTDRRLFIGLGNLYPRTPPIDLARVARVSVRRGLAGRLFGVGTVVFESDDPAVPGVELPGVFGPVQFAADATRCAEVARARCVRGARVRGHSPATAAGSPSRQLGYASSTPSS